MFLTQFELCETSSLPVIITMHTILWFQMNLKHWTIIFLLRNFTTLLKTTDEKQNERTSTEKKRNNSLSDFRDEKWKKWSEALAVHDTRPTLVILLLADPHLLKGAQRRQDRAANPHRVLAFGWGDDLDLHRAKNRKYFQVNKQTKNSKFT